MSRLQSSFRRRVLQQQFRLLSWAGNSSGVGLSASSVSISINHLFCFHRSLGFATLGGPGQSCAKAPSRLCRVLGGACRGWRHRGLPFEPGSPPGIYRVTGSALRDPVFLLSIDPTAGQFRSEGLESVLGPSAGFVPPRLIDLKFCPTKMIDLKLNFLR